MPDLLLHVGLGKTGTSYLQALLRLNREVLANRFDIVYPPRDEPANAAPEKITTGNGRGLLSSPENFASELATYGSRHTHLLFSNEGLWMALAKAPDLGFLPHVACAAGFDRVRLLLFVRDPIDHVASVSQQYIKRRGDTRTVDAHIAEDRTFETVADLLDRLDTLEEVETTLRNYSVCADRLPEALAEWLDVPVDALVRPPVERINRSLTRGELELQRAFNCVLQGSSHLISDPLCERLPHIPADRILPSVAAQAQALSRLAPALQRISEHLPPDEIRPAGIHPLEEDTDTLTFSRDQLKVLAESLGGEIAHLRTAKYHLDKAGSRALMAALFRRLARRAGLRG